MESAHPLTVRSRPDTAWLVVLATAGAALLAVFLALGVVLGRNPLPMPLVLGFGVGLLGTLALALARYDAAVMLGVFLLAAVRVEPARCS